MQSRDFAYWLQGYFEIVGASSNHEPDGLTSGQVEMIKKHLAMVFVHEIDPSMGGHAQQAKLNNIHGGAVGGLPSGLVARC
jgi:hypothetical protein